MQNYLHRVVGLYASLNKAQAARDLIVAGGLPPTQIRVLTAIPSLTGTDTKADSDDVLQDVLRDGAIGAAVGTAAGGRRIDCAGCR